MAAGMRSVRSKNGVPIRLTEERWLHITAEHSEMAGHYDDVFDAIQNPDAVYEGKAEELLAVKELEAGKYVVVVYKEVSREDGFVIAAYFVRGIKRLEKMARVWPRVGMK